MSTSRPLSTPPPPVLCTVVRIDVFCLRLLPWQSNTTCQHLPSLPPPPILRRVVRIDVSSPKASWSDLVPQHERDVLQSAVALKGDHLVVR